MQQCPSERERVEHFRQLIQRIQIDGAIGDRPISIILLKLFNHCREMALRPPKTRDAPRLELRRCISSEWQRDGQPLFYDAANAASLPRYMITARTSFCEHRRMPAYASIAGVVAHRSGFHKWDVDAFASQQPLIIGSGKKHIEDRIEVCNQHRLGTKV